MAKTIILLFVVFFASTVTLGNDWQQNHIEINEDLKQLSFKADRVLWKNPLIEYWTQKIAEVATAAVKHITDRIKSVADEAHSVLQPFVEHVTASVKVLANEINSLVNRAKGLHLNTTECVGFAIENITNIPSKLEQDMKKCIDDTMDPAKKSADDMIEKIHNAANRLANELENNCSILNMVGCLTAIFNTGNKELIDLGIQAAKNLGDVIEPITNCGKNLIDDSLGKAHKIHKETVNCLNDLINNSTNRC